MRNGHRADVAAFVGPQIPVVTLEHHYLVTEKVAALEQNTTLFP